MFLPWFFVNSTVDFNFYNNPHFVKYIAYLSTLSLLLHLANIVDIHSDIIGRWFTLISHSWKICFRFVTMVEGWWILCIHNCSLLVTIIHTLFMEWSTINSSNKASIHMIKNLSYWWRHESHYLCFSPKRNCLHF